MDFLIYFSSLFNPILKFLTFLNQTILFAFFILCIIIYLWISGQKKPSIITLFSFISVTFWIFLIKILVKRPRPVLNSYIDAYSFPSAHAALSFMMAFILSYYFPKKKWLFYSFALFISFLKLYADEHFISDIIVGAIIGLLVAFLFLKNEKKIFNIPLIKRYLL